MVTASVTDNINCMATAMCMMTTVRASVYVIQQQSRQTLKHSATLYRWKTHETFSNGKQTRNSKTGKRMQKMLLTWMLDLSSWTYSQLTSTLFSVVWNTTSSQSLTLSLTYLSTASIINTSDVTLSANTDEPSSFSPKIKKSP